MNADNDNNNAKDNIELEKKNESKVYTSNPRELLESLNDAIARFSDVDSYCPTILPDDSIVRTFAPIGLEEPFQELYSILQPTLSSQKEATTSSAILMGPRGVGKSLLLERCLAACQLRNDVKFRHVSINGIVVRGLDVASVVYDILKQLSDIALEETYNLAELSQKRQKLEKEKYAFRLRQSTFTSNLSLLESTLKIAQVDEIPILIVLDELDSFTDEGERQLLLYHLFDRVATPGSNLCLIGLTSSFTALSLLEKRIRSRAEGTSKVIYVRPPASYQDLVKIIGHKLSNSHVANNLLHFISPVNSSKEDTSNHEMATKISACMTREFQCGKDLRWFSRVISSALSLYRHDYKDQPSSTFQSQYLLDALLLMGASISDDEDFTSATRQSEIHITDGQATDTRIQAMVDLSQPQVAVLLAARRILVRESHREDIAAPFTIQRILKEFESFRQGKYNLMTAIWQLLDRGLLIPAMNHSGGGALQYHVSNVYKTLDPITLMRLPLHLPISIDRELDELLKRNLLDCSTALKEWGQKSN